MRNDCRLTWLAMYDSWHARKAPVAPSRHWGVLWRELSDYGTEAAAYRWRSRGLWEAAALASDAGLLEQAHQARMDRADGGWEPLLPCHMPPAFLARVGQNAPPLFWIRGSREALFEPCVAIVGSRRLSVEESRFAEEAGEWCAANGYSVVSGGAYGADTIAGGGAQKESGCVTYFLPGSPAKEYGAASLICRRPEGPEFDRLEALRRNRWVYAASTFAILVASRFEEGGSWAGAIAARREKLAPLVVFQGQRPSSGNGALIRLGCASVRDAKSLCEFAKQSAERALAV